MGQQQDLHEDRIGYPEEYRCWSGNECLDSKYCLTSAECKRVELARKRKIESEERKDG